MLRIWVATVLEEAWAEYLAGGPEAASTERFYAWLREHRPELATMSPRLLETKLGELMRTSDRAPEPVVPLLRFNDDSG